MSKNIDFTKTISAEDEQYLAERQWMIRDAKLSGFDVRFESDGAEAEEPEDDEEEQEDPEEVDYSSLTKAELKAEIAARNEEREEDDQIEPDSDKNADLVAALENDDEAHADEAEAE